MLRLSIILIILSMLATACAIDLIYNPAARSTGAYCLLGLVVMGFAGVLVAMVMKSKTIKEAN